MVKIPRAYNFSGKCFEFLLNDAHSFFGRIKLESNIDSKVKIGFSKFLECLNIYLDTLDYLTVDNSHVKIYGSVTLRNRTIIRATSNYHKRAWFSDVAVSMDSEESDDYISDQGVCYGQVNIDYLIWSFIYANYK